MALKNFDSTVALTRKTTPSQDSKSPKEKLIEARRQMAREEAAEAKPRSPTPIKTYQGPTRKLLEAPTEEEKGIDWSARMREAVAISKAKRDGVNDIFDKRAAEITGFLKEAEELRSQTLQPILEGARKSFELYQKTWAHLDGITSPAARLWLTDAISKDDSSPHLNAAKAAMDAYRDASVIRDASPYPEARATLSEQMVVQNASYRESLSEIMRVHLECYRMGMDATEVHFEILKDKVQAIKDGAKDDLKALSPSSVFDGSVPPK